MGLRVNLGAGSDIRSGWLNIDNAYEFSSPYSEEGPGVWRLSERDEPWRADMRYLDDVRHGASLSDRCAELVLMNHSLHQLTYEDADLALDQAVRILEPGGLLVIVEADILGVVDELTSEFGGERGRFVLHLIDDETEPTLEGKFLRWATWYGERRSLWSWESLSERLSRRGLGVNTYGAQRLDLEEWAGNRALESFVVTAEKP